MTPDDRDLLKLYNEKMGSEKFEIRVDWRHALFMKRHSASITSQDTSSAFSSLLSAHRARVAGKGSPGACDEVLKRVIAL
jgi:hypothetical protein